MTTRATKAGTLTGVTVLLAGAALLTGTAPAQAASLASTANLATAANLASTASPPGHAHAAKRHSPATASRFCPVRGEQRLTAELIGEQRASVPPGYVVRYVERVYNPGPETFQEVVTDTTLSPHLTPKQYPAGTRVTIQNDHYLLTRDVRVPIHPGQIRTNTVSAVVGPKATSAAIRLQAWAVSQTDRAAHCTLAEPVVVIVQRVPKGAPHTGDGSTAARGNDGSTAARGTIADHADPGGNRSRLAAGLADHPRGDRAGRHLHLGPRHR